VRRFGYAYFFAVLVGTLLIGLEHLFLPMTVRVSTVQGVAGHDYAINQLGAFARKPFLIGLHAVFGVLFASMILIGLMATAIDHARKREIAKHEEWVLRAAMCGLGIALSRLYLMILVQWLGLPARESMAQVFWLGASTNLLLVELWIRRYGTVAKGLRVSKLS